MALRERELALLGNARLDVRGGDSGDLTGSQRIKEL